MIEIPWIEVALGAAILILAPLGLRALEPVLSTSLAPPAWALTGACALLVPEGALSGAFAAIWLVWAWSSSGAPCSQSGPAAT